MSATTAILPAVGAIERAQLCLVLWLERNGLLDL
jgi:hypothetical protein